MCSAAAGSPRQACRRARRRAVLRTSQPARRVGAELADVIVGRSELGEKPVRLLEVVAEDLLVLERTVAVDASAHSTKRSCSVARWRLSRLS